MSGLDGSPAGLQVMKGVLVDSLVTGSARAHPDWSYDWTPRQDLALTLYVPGLLSAWSSQLTVRLIIHSHCCISST